MQDQSLLIEFLTESKIKNFWILVEKLGFSVERDYYERCLERQKSQELQIVMAFLAGEPAGYCILNWQPKYAYFKKCGLPEIQDLNVLREYRKQGIGKAIIQFCENEVRKNGYDEIGIGVGLDGGFGAAQRLYVKSGYIPDGVGVTYDRIQVGAGEFRPIDENLSLMMTKKL